jgi:two-component system, NarL family, nitrate/nitrite response regulator NarL
LIRVFLVMRARFYRESLVEVLSRDGRMAVEGSTSDWQEAVACCAECDPNILICDLNVAEAFRGVRMLSHTFPEVAIVALGVPDTERDVLPWAEAGISGYVPWEHSLRELQETIINVSRGELHCSPRVAAALMRRLAALASERQGAPVEGRLTSREREVIALIAQGLSNKEIAQRLFIEVPTVKNHVHNILEKLHVRRRGQVVALLHQRG